MSRFDDEAKEWDTPKSRKRAKNIADAIRSQVPLSSNMSSLEYGCGTGLLSFDLQSELGPITLADNSDGMLEVLREKIKSRSLSSQMTSLKLDLSVDPLPDQRFDFVYTMMTLHHIRNTKQILNQFYELMNPSGYLCIADLDEEDGSFHGQDAEDVHKGFNRHKLANLAEEVGFKDISFSTAYKMEHEVDDGSTQPFPIFLMVAKRQY